MLRRVPRREPFGDRQEAPGRGDPGKLLRRPGGHWHYPALSGRRRLRGERIAGGCPIPVLLLRGLNWTCNQDTIILRDELRFYIRDSNSDKHSGNIKLA
jgi:hypothetical protein